MNRRLLVGLAAAGAVLTGVVVTLTVLAQDFQPEPQSQRAGEAVLDFIWIATGLIAWQQRPGNRVGPLMVAFGFVELLGFTYWDAAVPYLLASLVSALVIPLAVHVFTVFPGTRPLTRFERAFVVSTYAVFAFAALALLPFWDPRADDCPDCPPNPLRVEGVDLSDVFQQVGTVIAMVPFVILAVLYVQRFRRARREGRRALIPLLVTVAAAIVFMLAMGVADAVGADTASQVLNEIGFWPWPAIPVALLVGLLRTRLQRSAVADLVVKLNAAPDPAQLRDAIARTLRDDSLELALWLPELERYVNLEGNELDPGVDRGRSVTVLEHDGQRLAALIHDPALVDDPALVQAVGAAASIQLENARLQAELRAQLKEVRASRARIVTAGDAERRRLERDLHDGAQQRLIGVRLALQLARGRLADGGETVDELLDEADAEVVGALGELRALARGIHPAVLSAEGLEAALAALVRRLPVTVDLTVCPERLPAAVEATAYFVASEALANVVKHSGATRASVEVSRANGDVSIRITDDGAGGADVDGAGIRGLRDRVETLDGRLRVESPPGHGTRVTAAIPCG
jgi:signal transduction histidine kinase